MVGHDWVAYRATGDPGFLQSQWYIMGFYFVMRATLCDDLGHNNLRQLYDIMSSAEGLYSFQNLLSNSQFLFAPTSISIRRLYAVGETDQVVLHIAGVAAFTWTLGLVLVVHVLE